MRAIRATALALLLASPPLAAQSLPTTQRLSDTLPILADLYARRTAQFEREPVVTGRVLFLGNSITEGGDWARLTGDSTAINRGISGDVTFGLRMRLGDVTRRKPSKLFILIGINDISRDIPDAVIAENCRSIIREVQAASPGTRIFLQSVLPVNSDVRGFPQHYDKQPHVLGVNRRLRRVAAATGARYVDLHALFADPRGRLDAAYTGDGLHLNERGYQRWAGYLRRMGYL